MGKATKTKPRKTEAMLIAERADVIGMPVMQLARGDHAIVETPIRDAGKVKTETTLLNRGGTPVARWRAANLLSESQIAAIDYCERRWERLPGKGLVMDLGKVKGAGTGDGWAEVEARDDLHRIKSYVPSRYWDLFENVCRFDEPAGYAGSKLAEGPRDPGVAERDRAVTARLTVQFVADIIAMKEGLVIA